MRDLGQYSKFIVAIAGAIIAGLYSYYGAGNELVQTVVAIATALGVYTIPNN